MGGLLSQPSSSASSNPSSISNMSSSNSSQTHESKDELESQSPIKESSVLAVEEGMLVELVIKEDGTAPEGAVLGEEGEEEEVVVECPFCKFMKDGGCRDEFIEWENCIEEAEKKNEDIAESCFEITGALKKCMEVHRDYYAPFLQAEEEALKALEEKAKEGEEATTGSETDSQQKIVNEST